MSGLDLYQTQGELFAMLAVSLAVGLGLGCLYQLLRFLRAILSPRSGQGTTPLFRVVLFWEDILFAVVSSVAVILLCYYTNDGALRWPIIGGMAGGFFVYVQTLGRLTVKAEDALARFFRRLVKTICLLLWRPLGWVATPVGKALRRAGSALLGKAADRRLKRERRPQQQTETVGTIHPPPPPNTVFSTRRHP